MMSAPTNTIKGRDFQWVGKTGIDVFAHERAWFSTIEELGFPYIKVKLASDGTVEAGSFIQISGLNIFQDSSADNSIS